MIALMVASTSVALYLLNTTENFKKAQEMMVTSQLAFLGAVSAFVLLLVASFDQIKAPLKFIYSCFLKPLGKTGDGSSQQGRLEAFYKEQAESKWNAPSKAWPIAARFLARECGDTYEEMKDGLDTRIQRPINSITRRSSIGLLVTTLYADATRLGRLQGSKRKTGVSRVVQREDGGLTMQSPECEIASRTCTHQIPPTHELNSLR